MRGRGGDQLAIWLVGLLSFRPCLDSWFRRNYATLCKICTITVHITYIFQDLRAVIQYAVCVVLYCTLYSNYAVQSVPSCGILCHLYHHDTLYNIRVNLTTSRGGSGLWTRIGVKLTIYDAETFFMTSLKKDDRWRVTEMTLHEKNFEKTLRWRNKTTWRGDAATKNMARIQLCQYHTVQCALTWLERSMGQSSILPIHIMVFVWSAASRTPSESIHR